jgi:hypothetical protein
MGIPPKNLLIHPLRNPAVNLEQAIDRPQPREDFSDYVAQLQLHMALQARNLVPQMVHGGDPLHQLLHQTQADIEKIVSRQFES